MLHSYDITVVQSITNLVCRPGKAVEKLWNFILSKSPIFTQCWTFIVWIRIFFPVVLWPTLKSDNSVRTGSGWCSPSRGEDNLCSCQQKCCRLQCVTFHTQPWEQRIENSQRLFVFKWILSVQESTYLTWSKGFKAAPRYHLSILPRDTLKCTKTNTNTPEFWSVFGSNMIMWFTCHSKLSMFCLLFDGCVITFPEFSALFI